VDSICDSGRRTPAFGAALAGDGRLSDTAAPALRSTDASHGFVFDHCRFETAPGATAPLLGRNTENYPDSEVVLLDCALGDIEPVAWQLPTNVARMRYLEFRSTRVTDGKPADVSHRHPASRQPDVERDAETIAMYRNPARVLGWEPEK
jgi:pectinesterase